MPRHSANRMTQAEIVAEILWFNEAGIHPEHIAQSLGRKVSTLGRLLREQGEPDLANRFETARGRMYGAKI